MLYISFLSIFIRKFVKLVEFIKFIKLVEFIELVKFAKFIKLVKLCGARFKAAEKAVKQYG